MPPDVRFDGNKTVKLISSTMEGALSKQGIFEYLDRLHRWFDDCGITDDTRRIAFLKQGIKHTISKAQLEGWYTQEKAQGNKPLCRLQRARSAYIYTNVLGQGHCRAMARVYATKVSTCRRVDAAL